MGDEQAIRARLDDNWPEGEGIECRPGKVGGRPCIAGTRWYVNIWYDCYADDYAGTRLDADATDAYVLAGWSWLTPEQVATARAYVLAHLPLFEARAIFTNDADRLKALYRADCAALLALVDAARTEREAAEPCAGCGQPFTPVADSCLCRTCDAGLRESNERTYQWQRDALARLRAALVLIGGHLSTVDTSRHWLVKQRGIRRLVFRALGVESITPEMLACALLDAAKLAAPVRAPGREGG